MGDLRRPNKNRFWNTPLIVITIIAVAIGIWSSYAVGYRRGESDGRTSGYREGVNSGYSVAKNMYSNDTSGYRESLEAAVLAARSEQIETEALREVDETIAPTLKPPLKKTVTVYWVSGGKVWHTTQYCRTLARSTNIREGSIADSGKARACKVCG